MKTKDIKVGASISDAVLYALTSTHYDDSTLEVVHGLLDIDKTFYSISKSHCTSL